MDRGIVASARPTGSRRAPRSRAEVRAAAALLLCLPLAGGGCATCDVPAADARAAAVGETAGARAAPATSRTGPLLVRRAGVDPQGRPVPAGPILPLPERSLESPPSNEVDIFADRYREQQAEARKDLGIMTGVTIVSGVAIMALMTLLPASATHWDKGDDLWGNFTSAFTSPPVWDSDEWPVNYVVHPWMGSIFYLLARDLGAGPLGSFAYSTGLSASWEYFVESWSEQPSQQDLMTTSTVGSVFGEAFYQVRTQVLEAGASAPWKKAVGWILDPVDLAYTLTGLKPEPPPPAEARTAESPLAEPAPSLQ
jgi:hypothetical protein